MASTTLQEGMKVMSSSGMTRRGSQNPNRNRQPKRVGTSPGMFGKVGGMLRKVLKGPDMGMG